MFPMTFRAGVLLPLALLTATACASQDDARVQNMLNQRGFGERFSGDASEQYYLGIGDQIVVLDPGHPELNGAYRVRMDGVIDVPMIGEIYVAGLTLPDVGEILTRRFREYITSALVDVQLGASTSKVFYVDGQVALTGPVAFRGGETLFNIVFRARPTILADEDSVRLIRSDPVNPLVMKFDYDDMLQGGWSRGNVPVRENDIVFIPPNILGHIAIALQALLAPVGKAFQALLTASRLLVVTDTFGERNNSGRGRGRSSYGGSGFGGFSGLFLVPQEGAAPGQRCPEPSARER